MSDPIAAPEDYTDDGNRQLAVAATAQMFAGQGAEVTGCRVMSFLILFETYLGLGSDRACEALGWDVTEGEVIHPNFRIVDTIGRGA